MNNCIQEVYANISGDDSVPYKGYLFIDNKFGDYLHERVLQKYKDSEWEDRLVSEAEDALSKTGFMTSVLVDIFRSKEKEVEWRIGEYLAECLLEDKYNAKFYYNNSRDAKNPNANDTGADLVGLIELNDDTCFLFGEVKTSNDENTPPNVVYGKSGMIYQLENLRDDVEKRNSLVRWIWGKAVLIKGEFKEECSKALLSYQKSNKNKVKLFGVLVRDTDVNNRDIKSRAKALNKDLPDHMDIELISVYSGLTMENSNWRKAMNRSV